MKVEDVPVLKSDTSFLFIEKPPAVRVKHFSLQGNLALIIITVFLEFRSRIIFSLIHADFIT